MYWSRNNDFYIYIEMRVYAGTVINNNGMLLLNCRTSINLLFINWITGIMHTLVNLVLVYKTNHNVYKYKNGVAVSTF